jgi:microcystin-dependent protein
MGNPYMGQLLLGAWNFAPRGYALCNGQLQGISQNAALFALLGTAFGGDGIRTFALPNLQGRTPIGVSPFLGLPIGTLGGQSSHTLTNAEVPGHTHTLNAATNKASTTSAVGAIPALGDTAIYAPPSNLAAMNAGSVTAVGGQPHENQQPFLVMNWCISLSGIFPSRN